ncbi:MAG: hypothetical protein K0R49_1354 [Burkholderiales bacterium]|nr:hypothetical protein [Burkholderiales bacterium]
MDIDVIKINCREATNLIQLMRPDLAKVMQCYDMDNFFFYKASYPFGSPIINSGKCYLPLSNGGSIEFNDPRLPDDIAKDLSYDPLNEEPLAIILNKNSEFYIPTAEAIMPHAIIHPGEMYGIPKAIDTDADTSLIWNLNAGVRSLFTLTKVTSQPRHDELHKTYGIKHGIPLSSLDQWKIFVEIAKGANSAWRSEILYFPRKLINFLKTPEFVQLSDILQKIRRESYNIWHNSAVIWDAAFNNIEVEKKLTYYSSYALSTARQQYLIAANSAPGLRPATNEDSAPIKLFQEAYGKVYGLNDEKQSTIIMEATNLLPDSRIPVYYSLNFPMLAKCNPNTFKGKSLITLLTNIEHIIRVFQENIPLNRPRIKSLYNTSNSTSFSFYHCNSDPQTYKNILNSETLAREDERFTKNHTEAFAAYSHFFKGCIKIQHI